MSFVKYHEIFDLLFIDEINCKACFLKNENKKENFPNLGLTGSVMEVKCKIKDSGISSWCGHVSALIVLVFSELLFELKSFEFIF